MIIQLKCAWQIIAAGLATHQQQYDGMLPQEWRKTVSEAKLHNRVLCLRKGGGEEKGEEEAGRMQQKTLM
jgi:hypothetical protein